MIRGIINRIRTDFFIFERIGDYEDIIKSAQKNGYQIVSHSEYFDLVNHQQIAGKKLLIIRQDIDSDPKYALKWIKLQQQYKVNSSMYFRLCTFDKKVMHIVQNSGADCGYHYEEIATYAKKNHILNKEEVQNAYPEIIQLFKSNLKWMEDKLGFKIRYIASHGDFANRQLQLNNHQFVTPELLKECNLVFEAYQPEFTETYSINISDCGYPNLYKGELTPIQAIAQEVPIIHLLMHPKHWRSNWYWNIYENLKRFKEGIFFR